MTKNQKIAIGCGGGGCLLLIIVAILAVAGYFYYRRNAPAHDRSGNYNFNSNRNSNNTNSAPNTSSSMSDDDQHRLFQAAATSDDRQLMKRVNEKLGLLDANGAPRSKYGEFSRDHIAWIFRNTDWISKYNTPEKARAYVEAHIND